MRLKHGLGQLSRSALSIMYFSAASRSVPDSARRCRSTSSTPGCRLFSPLNLGGNAVQTTESTFLASAHSLSPGIETGDHCPLDQSPMYFSFGRAFPPLQPFFRFFEAIAVHKGP